MTGFSLLDDIDWSKLGQVSPMVTTDADRAVVGDTATAINPDWSLGKTSNLDQPNAVGLSGEHADKQQPGAVQAGRWQVPPPGVNTEPTDSGPGVGDIIGGVLTAPLRAIRAVDYTVKRGLGIADSPESQIYSARSALGNAANADPEAAGTITGLQTYLNSSSPTAAGQRPTPPRGTGYGDIAQEWLNVLIPGQSPYDKAKAEGRQLSTMLQQLQGRKTLGDMVNTVSARQENRAQTRSANVKANLDEKYGEPKIQAEIAALNASAANRDSRTDLNLIDSITRNQLNAALIGSRNRSGAPRVTAPKPPMTFAQFRNAKVAEINASGPSDDEILKRHLASREKLAEAYRKYRDEYAKAPHGWLRTLSGDKMLKPEAFLAEQAKGYGLNFDEDVKLDPTSGEIGFADVTPEYIEKVAGRGPRRAKMPPLQELQAEYEKQFGPLAGSPAATGATAQEQDPNNVVVSVDPTQPGALKQLEAAMEAVKQAQARGGTKAIVQGIDQSLTGKGRPETFDPGQETDQEMIVRLSKRGMSQAEIAKALVAKRQAAEKAARGR